MLRGFFRLYLPKQKSKIKVTSEVDILSLIDLEAQATFLASKVLDFCDVATNSIGEKEFYLFADEHDATELDKKRRSFKEGLCLGLSHLFLFSCMISDLQENQSAATNNDLAWFKRCMELLNKPYKDLSTNEKKDLVEFCSLVMHFHNNRNLAFLGRSIFTDQSPPGALEGKLPFLTDDQYNHVFNVEFTGKHEVQFEPKQGERYDNDDCPVLRVFADQPGPLYATISLITSENTHCVALYKNKGGQCMFYDPQRGFFPVKLNNIEDIVQFKKWMLEESTIPLLGKPEVGFDVLIMKPALKDKSTLEGGVKP